MLLLPSAEADGKNLNWGKLIAETTTCSGLKPTE